MYLLPPYKGGQGVDPIRDSTKTVMNTMLVE